MRTLGLKNTITKVKNTINGLNYKMLGDSKHSVNLKTELQKLSSLNNGLKIDRKKN